MKTTVIHHSADFDGIFCREIARKFLPAAEFIGWDYKDDKIPFPTEGTVYVLDLSPECFDSLPAGYTARLIWIDHHKSAIDKFDGGASTSDWPSSGQPIPGYRIDGVAACRLAWQWFTHDYGPNNPNCHETDYDLPKKEHYIDREVPEPLAVRLAGEYDVLEHALSGGDDIAFQFGLDSFDILRWDWLLSVRPNDPDPDGYTARIVEAGKSSMRCYTKRDADVMRTRSFQVKWEGLTFLALNTPRCNSNTFAALDKPETGHDALMAFYFNGRDWNFSLYHANHRKDIDLSLIAVKHGGGGHKGACGFKLKELPFTTTN